MKRLILLLVTCVLFVHCDLNTDKNKENSILKEIKFKKAVALNVPSFAYNLMIIDFIIKDNKINLLLYSYPIKSLLLYNSEDRGLTWSNAIVLKESKDEIRNNIEYKMNSKGILYKFYKENNNVFCKKSLDFGNKWQAEALIAESESGYARYIGMNVCNGDNIIVIIGSKFYLSEDRGNTWKLVRSPMTRSVYNDAFLLQKDAEMSYIECTTKYIDGNVFPDKVYSQTSSGRISHWSEPKYMGRAFPSGILFEYNSYIFNIYFDEYKDALYSIKAIKGANTWSEPKEILSSLNENNPEYFQINEFNTSNILYISRGYSVIIRTSEQDESYSKISDLTSIISDYCYGQTSGNIRLHFDIIGDGYLAWSGNDKIKFSTTCND